MQQGLLPAVSQRVNRMCQEIPKEYGVSHWDYAQLIRSEAHLADRLTVAYEHLVQRNTRFNYDWHINYKYSYCWMKEHNILSMLMMNAMFYHIKLLTYTYYIKKYRKKQQRFSAVYVLVNRTLSKRYKFYLWVNIELHAIIPHFDCIVSCCQQESTVLTHSQGRALMFVHLRQLNRTEIQSETLHCIVGKKKKNLMTV